MGCTALCCFLMVLVHSPTQLLLARIVLAVVDGMAMAGTAPLVRDFSPRLGRAQAFGFWTWGPVGANFLAAAIAGATLPLFDDSWRSQFVIMGVFSLVVSVVIAFNIADLSPELRARIRQTEQHAIATADQERPARFRELFRHRNVWAHVVGIALWLVIYLTLSLLGQTMLAEGFHLSAATASAIMSAFWSLDLIVLVVVGRLSDRLQLRKPLCVIGTVLGLGIAGYLASLLHDPGRVSHLQLMVTGALLGGALALAYSPWMANFSEDAEDIDPRLQGSAWGLFGGLSKGMAVVVLFVVPRAVSAIGWDGWMFIGVVCLAAFVPAVFLFRGPWRPNRGRAPAAEARQPLQTVD
jgi:OPA family glycerol-3-phosphate transporter-like MFS transporter